jgi:hypothetical protein
MATSIKTVKYSIPITTTVIPDATLTNLAQITLEIPEASPTFISAMVEVNFQDIITATGGTITEHRVAVRLGGAAYATFTELDDIANSAENIAGVIAPIDFTAHFNTNWSGTSMTMDTQVFFDHTTGTTLGMRNVSAIIALTYQYDDDIAVNPVQLQTAKIPLESLIGTLSTTANSNIGSNQIPQLTGAGGIFDGVNSLVVKDYFFMISGNQASAAVTDFTISAAISGGATTVFGIEEHALATGCYYQYIYRPTIPSLGSAHNLQIWSNLTNVYNHAVIDLYVTYTFQPIVGSKILNSIELPIEIASPLGSTAVTDASRFTRDIFIQETNIVYKQSAFRIDFNANTTATGLRFRAGTQAYRAYTNLIGVAAGMSSLQQRIDSESSQGAGFSLSRGKNTIVIDGYVTAANDVTNISGVLTLNYLSDIVSGVGVGSHNHTTYQTFEPWNAQLLDLNRSLNKSFQIPNTNYYIIGTGFRLYLWQTTAANGITFDVEVLSGESKGAGYSDIYTDVVQTDAEIGVTITNMSGRNVFKRFPQDADPDRLNIEVESLRMAMKENFSKKYVHKMLDNKAGSKDCIKDYLIAAM